MYQKNRKRRSKYNKIIFIKNQSKEIARKKTYIYDKYLIIKIHFEFKLYDFIFLYFTYKS